MSLCVAETKASVAHCDDDGSQDGMKTLLTGMLQLSSADTADKPCGEDTHKTLRMHCWNVRSMTCVDVLLKTVD